MVPTFSSQTRPRLARLREASPGVAPHGAPGGEIVSGGWTPAEVERLAAALARPDGTPDCPRCGERLERRRVKPRRDVAYVRDRILLLCGSCGARGALDRREIERRRAGRDGPDAEGSEGNGSAEDGGAGNGGS